jgi:hypothetical protein
MATATEIRSNMKELKDINTEIKRLNIILKGYRDRKKELEETIIEYLDRTGQPGIKYEDLIVLAGEKKARDRKKKEEKEFDVLTLLEERGIRDSRNLYNDILEAMKGEEKVVSSLKIKEYQNN